MVTPITNEQWSEIADDYMSKMGFSDTHLRCYILHEDNEGQHIHIIASRIDLDGGKLYLGKNENLISTRITQELERDYNLTRTQGPKPTRQPSPLKPKKLSRNEKKMEERQREQSPRSVIQSALEEVLASRPEVTDFVQQLAGENIKAIPNIATTGKMNGFSFEYSGIAFKASQLGKGYSWSKLQNKIDYQPERDNAYLRVLKYPAVNEASVVEEGNYASPAPASIESIATEQTLDQEPLAGISARKMTMGEMLAQFTKDLEDTMSRKIDELDTIKRETPASAKESSPSSRPTTPGIDSFAGLAATPDLSSLSATASAKQRKTTASKPTEVDESKISIGEMLIYLDEKRDAKKRLENVVNEARERESMHQSRHSLQGRWLLWIPYSRKVLHLLKEHGSSLLHAAKPFERVYRATSLEEEGPVGSTAEPETQRPVTNRDYPSHEPPSKGRRHGKFK